METAKVFWSGRSQAVRLPKAYRFESDEVRIRRHGDGHMAERRPAGSVRRPHGGRHGHPLCITATSRER